MLSNGLPWLTVFDRHIVDTRSQRRVLLRGVNRSGLEYAEPAPSGFLDSVGLSESEIAYMVKDWGANVIRVPFNQQSALNGRGALSASVYLEALDRAIFWASRAGAYTLLDLHWLDSDSGRGLNSDGSCNRVPALPNKASVEVWGVLAARYKSESAVLFDVFNEPHSPIRDDSNTYEGIEETGATFQLLRRNVTMAEWQPWARHLVRAIRNEHPRSLIFVPGVSWAYDLRGMPLTTRHGSSDVFPNVVYNTHVYPWLGSPLRARRSPWPVPGKSSVTRWRVGGAVAHRSLTWREAFGALSRRAPVFIGEWGGGPEHIEWGACLVRYARWLGLGWTAWSWSDRPRLVVDARSQCYDVTDFGRIVRRELSAKA